LSKPQKLGTVGLSVCRSVGLLDFWIVGLLGYKQIEERIVMPLGLSVTDTFAWAAIIDQSRKMRTGNR